MWRADWCASDLRRRKSHDIGTYATRGLIQFQDLQRLTPGIRQWARLARAMPRTARDERDHLLQAAVRPPVVDHSISIYALAQSTMAGPTTFPRRWKS